MGWSSPLLLFTGGIYARFSEVWNTPRLSVWGCVQGVACSRQFSFTGDGRRTTIDCHPSSPYSPISQLHMCTLRGSACTRNQSWHAHAHADSRVCVRVRVRV